MNIDGLVKSQKKGLSYPCLVFRILRNRINLMGKKQFIAVLSLAWLLLSACVSHQKIQDQNDVLNKELKLVRLELYEAEERIKSLDAE